MDRLFNSNWFVRIVSFFIALMLFAMVNMDNISSRPGVLPIMSSANYTLEEVELTVIYNEEKYAVMDQTEFVKVNLRGSQSEITMFQLMRPTYQVFVDVTDREEGVHTLSVQHRGFPNDLNVSIVPQFVKVELERKQTISLPVQVELYNTDKVEEGYTVGEASVEPTYVKVTAARSKIANVAQAKAYVDVSGAKKTMEEAVPITLYDDNGRELDLPIEPEFAEVKVPIISPHTTLPAHISYTGQLVEGLSIEEVKVEPEDITVYGPVEVIDKMDKVDVGELHLAEITKSGTYELTVHPPPGVEKVVPEEVKVTIVISKEETKEWTDIPVEVIGLQEGASVSFAGEEAKTVTLTARGPASILEKMTEQDVQVYVDLSELSKGDHHVQLQVKGPQYVTFSLSEQTIPITISNEQFGGEVE